MLLIDPAIVLGVAVGVVAFCLFVYFGSLVAREGDDVEARERRLRRVCAMIDAEPPFIPVEPYAFFMRVSSGQAGRATSISPV